jgi:hypothetical protein
LERCFIDLHHKSSLFTSLHHSTLLPALAFRVTSTPKVIGINATPVTLAIYYVVVRVLNSEFSSQTVGPLGASSYQYRSFDQYHQFAGSPALLFVFTNCGTVVNPAIDSLETGLLTVDPKLPFLSYSSFPKTLLFGITFYLESLRSYSKLTLFSF